MDKLLKALTPTKFVGFGAAFMAIAGWISQLHFETEGGRIAQLVAYVVLALAVLAVVGFAHRAPRPEDGGDKSV